MREYLVRHLTRYSYGAPALDSHSLTCLRPRSFPGQRVIGDRLRVEPEPDWHSTRVDVYGNRRDAFSHSKSHSRLLIESLSRIRRVAPPPSESALSWEEAVLPGGGGWCDAPPLFREFRCPSPQLPTPEVAGFDAEDCFPPGLPVVEALRRFMGRVYDAFSYAPGSTETFTPLDQVYAQKSGVCQDFAHAAIAELRRRGFAAGYVSGYLETLPPEGREKLRGADATHAWYAVYVPGTGWIHCDPTNKVLPGESHLVAAWGRDYGDVAPVKGVLLGGGIHHLEVEVDVWSWPDQVPADMREACGDWGRDDSTGGVASFDAGNGRR